MEISLSKPVTSEKGDHLFLLFLASVVIRCAFFSSRREEEEEEKKVNTSHAFVYSCLTLCAQHLVFALIPPAGEYTKNSRLSRPPTVLALGFHPSGPRLPGRPQRRKMTLQSGRGRRSRCPSHTPSWTDH